VALPRFTIFVAPERGRPGRPLRADDLHATGIHLSWRLLAANNRDVARSAVVYGDLAYVLDSVAELQETVGNAIAVSTRSGRADWSWRLRLDARDIAVSSRTYQRRLQCEAACALFVVLVPLAIVDAAPSGDLVEKTSSPGP